MASKRRIKRRQCLGKQRHATREDAWKHAGPLLRRGAWVVSPYKCQFCGMWHVGHTGRPKIYQGAA